MMADPEHPALNCLNCASFCCKLAGYVEVRRADIRRLADHLDLTVPEFEEKHIVEVTRKGEKLIKGADKTCQFLGADRRCTVYSARPRDCQEYVCWDQHDDTVYNFANYYLKPIGSQQRTEEQERIAAEREKAERRAKKRRRASRR
jgi:Fe-S-cluster containining protein